MNEKYELIEHIYKAASMASYSLDTLINSLKDKDNKIKAYLEEISKEYVTYKIKSKKILEENNIPLSEENIAKKMMASMGVKKEVHKDNSDSAIADMLIQGISMGSIEMEKKIKDYNSQVSKEYLHFAKEFLKFQEVTIEKLKKYL